MADRFLLSCRQGRWRWPWALGGTILCAALVVALATLNGAIEPFLALPYGETSTPTELLPGRLDTYAAFVTFALALIIPPVIVTRFWHGRSPSLLLGPMGRIDWSHLLKGSGAILSVFTVGTLIDFAVQPAAYAWQQGAFARLPWIVLALPVILLQSFSEELLFKGYLVRTWGAAVPVRSLVVIAVALLFTSGHAINPDVSQDTIFNLGFFFLAELMTLAIFFRTHDLGAVTGLHWINNVWAMCIVATLPGQSAALPFAAYTDPILSSGGSRLTSPMAYVEIVMGLALLWVLLTWRRSPFYLEQAPAGVVPAGENSSTTPPPPTVSPPSIS